MNTWKIAVKMAPVGMCMCVIKMFLIGVFSCTLIVYMGGG